MVLFMGYTTSAVVVRKGILKKQIVSKIGAERSMMFPGLTIWLTPHRG